jgi:leucyl-tRNA synthetase
LQTHIQDTTRYYENLEFRSAISAGFFEPLKDLSWYLMQGGNGEGALIFYKTITKMMSPIIPHLTEEIWEKLGEKVFISLSPWPTHDPKKIDKNLETCEEYIRQLMQDITDVIKFKKIEPSNIHIYVAPTWKFKLYKMVQKSHDVKKIMQDPDIRSQGKSAINLINKYKGMKQEVLDQDTEIQAIKDASDFLSTHFNAKIHIHKAGQAKFDPMNKQNNANPGKPAIYLC